MNKLFISTWLFYVLISKLTHPSFNTLSGIFFVYIPAFIFSLNFLVLVNMSISLDNTYFMIGKVYPSITTNDKGFTTCLFME